MKVRHQVPSFHLVVGESRRSDRLGRLFAGLDAAAAAITLPPRA
jgi:hypothetical protein